VLANKTRTVPGKYITLPNIAACARTTVQHDIGQVVLTKRSSDPG